MNNKPLTILVLLFAICLVSCDRPECQNENLVFENNKPKSKEYKDELVEQLRTLDQTKLRYWLQEYQVIDGTESLFFNVQGEGLCAVLHMTMDHWDGLEYLRENKGVGSRGAEFTKLEYEIVQEANATEFIYVKHGRIID